MFGRGEQPNSTVSFYRRVRDAVAGRTGLAIMDIGAGAGSFWEQSPEIRPLRDLRDLGTVWAVDVDPIVRNHPCSDHIVVLDEATLPFADDAFDLIVSDVTFEHIEQPEIFAAELARVLRPGGVICARTPNKWGYPALAARIIPQRLHAAVLRRVQPWRKEHDVFPAFYRMNDRRSLARWFYGCRVEVHHDHAEPAYSTDSGAIKAALALFHRMLPDKMSTSLQVTVRKPVA